MKHIPTQILKHEEENVFFAFRTMEENHIRMEGKISLPHRHDFYTVLLVKNACGSHLIDYVDHKMIPETVFFVSPGQVHQVRINKNTPSGDILMFSEDFLNRNYISKSFIDNLGMFSCNAGTPPLHLPEEIFLKLIQHSNEIRNAFEGNSPFKFDTIAAHLKLFLIECNQCAVPSKDINPQTLQSGRLIIQSFRTLLDQKYKMWHKVSEYAQAMNITPDYLNNVVKTNIGKTAKEMIFQRIIIEAKRLGLHTNLSSKEISYSLGYDDPSHFSKFFKKETSQSFSGFRNEVLKNL